MHNSVENVDLAVMEKDFADGRIGLTARLHGVAGWPENENELL